VKMLIVYAYLNFIIYLNYARLDESALKMTAKKPINLM